MVKTQISFYLLVIDFFIWKHQFRKYLSMQSFVCATIQISPEPKKININNWYYQAKQCFKCIWYWRSHTLAILTDCGVWKAIHQMNVAIFLFFRLPCQIVWIYLVLFFVSFLLYVDIMKLPMPKYLFRFVVLHFHMAKVNEEFMRQDILNVYLTGMYCIYSNTMAIHVCCYTHLQLRCFRVRKSLGFFITWSHFVRISRVLVKTKLWTNLFNLIFLILF